MIGCKFEWESDYEEHECSLSEGHDGEHECQCGETCDED